MTAPGKRIPAWRFAVLAIMACSAFLVGIVVAKMMTDTPIEKSGEMHIAKWMVEAVATDDGDVDLVAGRDIQTYSLMVTNNSEVVSSYAIKVSGVPDDVKVGLDSGDLQLPNNGEVLLEDTGGDLSFTSPDNVRSHTLKMQATENADVTPDTGTDLNVEIVLKQKDPRL